MSFGNTKKQKKFLLILFPALLLAFVCFGIFFPIHSASAAVWDYFSPGAWAEWAFKRLLYGVFWFAAKLAIIAVFIFNFATNPDFISGPGGIFNRQSIYTMWQFIRDFFNIFFILILLFSALCTIFQIEKYNYKKILLSLVIMALLVNFSFPISRFIIDAANVPMYFFQNQMFDYSGGGQAMNAVLSASKLEYILIPEKTKVDDLEVGQLIMSIVFMFILSASLLALSLLFLNRVTGLLILVIFSSVGFMGFFPGFEKYSSMWWSKLLQYAFFGPIAMLFLLVSVRFMTEISNDGTFASLQKLTPAFSAGWDNGFLGSVVLFMIPVILLWFTISMGQHFSIEGAEDAKKIGGAVLGWGRKAALGAFVKAPWMATKWGGRKLDTNVLAPGGFSPKAWYGGIKSYMEHQVHEDQKPVDLAKGAVQNKINAMFAKIPIVKKLTHRDKVDYKYLKEQQLIREEETELKERSGGVINEQMGRVALEEGLVEHDQEKLSAALYTLARTNGLDNVVGDFWQRYKGKKDKDGKYIVKYHINADGSESVNIAENYDSILKAMMDEVGIDPDMQQKHRYNFGELAKTSGDEVFAERASPDLKTGKFTPVTGKEQAQKAVRQMLKMRAQGLLDVAHGRVFAEQQQVHKKDGTVDRQWGDLHDVAEEFADNMKENIVDQMSRMKPEAVEALKSLWTRANSPDEKVRKTAQRFIDTYNKEGNNAYRRFVLKGIGLLDSKSTSPTVDVRKHAKYQIGTTEARDLIKGGGGSGPEGGASGATDDGPPATD